MQMNLRGLSLILVLGVSVAASNENEVNGVLDANDISLLQAGLEVKQPVVALEVKKGNGGGDNCNDSPGDPLASGCYTIGTRTVTVRVPLGAGPFPVLIGCHGNGGTGSNQCKSLVQSAVATSHILVCPDGVGNSWNVVAETSTEDDVGFVGTTLVDTLAAKSNVQADFTLYGHSNGAALTNRILIENDKAEITAAITDKSQLNTEQWHDGQFYIGGGDNSYSTVQRALTPRRLLQITGTADTTIPPAGGSSLIPGRSGNLMMVPWRNSAANYARAYGHTGSNPTVVDGATSYSLTFESSNVQAYNFKDQGHGAALSGNSDAATDAIALITSFVAAR